MVCSMRPRAVDGFHSARKSPRSISQRPEFQSTRTSSSPDSVPGGASSISKSKPASFEQLTKPAYRSSIWRTKVLVVAAQSYGQPADLDHHAATLRYSSHTRHLAPQKRSVRQHSARRRWRYVARSEARSRRANRLFDPCSASSILRLSRSMETTRPSSSFEETGGSS